MQKITVCYFLYFVAQQAKNKKFTNLVSVASACSHQQKTKASRKFISLFYFYFYIMLCYYYLLSKSNWKKAIGWLSNGAEAAAAYFALSRLFPICLAFSNYAVSYAKDCAATQLSKYSSFVSELLTVVIDCTGQPLTLHYCYSFLQSMIIFNILIEN